MPLLMKMGSSIFGAIILLVCIKLLFGAEFELQLNGTRNNVVDENSAFELHCFLKKLTDADDFPGGVRFSYKDKKVCSLIIRNGNCRPGSTSSITSAECKCQNGNTSYSLTIDNVQRNYTGNWSCGDISKNGNRSPPIYLKVHYGPKPGDIYLNVDVDGVHRTNKGEINIKVGQHVFISCGADCKPSCSFKWFKRQNPTDIGLSQNGSLSFPAENPLYHSGIYICLAENEQSTMRNTKNLTINVVPPNPVKPSIKNIAIHISNTSTTTTKTTTAIVASTTSTSLFTLTSTSTKTKSHSPYTTTIIENSQPTPPSEWYHFYLYIGLTVGSVIFICCLAGVLIFFARRKREKDSLLQKKNSSRVLLEQKKEEPVAMEIIENEMYVGSDEVFGQPQVNTQEVEILENDLYISSDNTMD